MEHTRLIATDTGPFSTAGGAGRWTARTSAARVLPGTRQWPSPYSGRRGARFVPGRRRSHGESIHSIYRKEKESLVQCAECVSAHQRSLRPLSAVVITSGNRESKQAVTDTAMIDCRVRRRRMPDVMTVMNIWDDFEM